MKTLSLMHGPSNQMGDELRDRLASEVLPAYLASRRWFMAKARTLESTRIVDASRFDENTNATCLMIVEANYSGGPPDRYFVPLIVRSEDPSTEFPIEAVLCRLEWPGGVAWIVDALADRHACHALLGMIAHRLAVPTALGNFTGEPTTAFGTATSEELSALDAQMGRAEQSHSAVRYGDRFLLKVFRKLEAGTSPEVEIGRFLTERTDFANTPRTGGVLDYHAGRSEPITVGLLQQYVANDGTGWEHALEVLGQYYSRIEQNPDLLPPAAADDRPLVEVAHHSPPPILTQHIADYLPFAVQLGRQTGELHLALASVTDDSDFGPEPLTVDDLKTLAMQIRYQVESSLSVLRSRVSKIDPPSRSVAHEVLERSDVLLDVLDELMEVVPTSSKIRVHGDLHLGQVLRRGDDFLFIDFEGEPTKPLAQRRARYPALKDVVGLIRSFDYAAHAALFAFAGERAEVRERLAPWASAWQTWISAAFLRQYLATADDAEFLPTDPEAVSRFLRAFTLDKALYELDYEFNNRPAWVGIPLHGIVSLINRHESSGYEPEGD